MSAAQPRPSSSQTTTVVNGAPPSRSPPDVPSKPPPDMTLNGNKPASPEKDKAMPGGISGRQSSLLNVARGGGPVAVPTIDGTTATVKQRRPAPYEQLQPSSSNKNPAISEDASDNGRRQHSVALMGGSPADGDAAYCAEIARRSAARAALHLGIEGMEGAALDALGSVLMVYMEQVGTTVSTNVEASGRSSAHANVYDALNAVELCTAPAATQILGSMPTAPSLADHINLKEGNEQPMLDDDGIRPTTEGQELQRGWEGLASFLFGPDWFSIPLEGDDDADDVKAGKNHAKSSSLVRTEGNDTKCNGQTPAVTKKPGGKTILPPRPNSVTAASNTPKASGKGKQLPNLMKGNPEKSVSFSLEHKNSIGKVGTPAAGLSGAVPSGNDDGKGKPENDAGHAGRWHAPYPNTVPSFPLVTRPEDVANPHRLPGGGSSISLSLHDLATEMEACRETPSAKRPRKGGSGDLASSKPSAAVKAARLRDQMAEKAAWAALRIPDDVYSTMGTVWGSFEDAGDASHNMKGAHGLDGPKKTAIINSKKSASGASKKVSADVVSQVKFDPSTKEPPTQTAGVPLEHAETRPPHVPNFLPPFPTEEYSDMMRDKLSASITTSAVMGDVLSRMHQRGKRKAPPPPSNESVDGKKTTPVSERDDVRRSVIGLGKPVGPTYWGSKWLENDTSNNSGRVNNLSGVSVLPGEGGSASASTSAAATKKPGSDASSSQVVPLGRASGSRLSKILEGSMNVS